MNIMKFMQYDEEKNISSLIGKNQEYYLPVFEVLIASGSCISWNWSAFFFSFLWMFYRKMFLASLICFVMWVLCFEIYPFLIVPFSMGVGLLGNYIYMSNVYKAFLKNKRV